MEVGKKYRVFYHDGERVRDKILIFKSVGNENIFLVFFNPQTQLEESIMCNRIVRFEESNEEDKHDNV